MRTPARSRSMMAVALAVAALPQVAVRAAGPASLLWTGGSNTWDTATARWQLLAPNDTIWNNTTDAATIAAFNTAGNIAIANSGITAGGLNFQAGANGINLNGPGALTLTTGNVTVASSATATINAFLVTPAGLSLQGGGTLSLANDFSSNLTVTAGVLSSPSALSLGNGAISTVSLANIGSAWNNAGLLDLGSSGGTATAIITTGASLHTDTLTLGASGATGSIALSLPGSTLTMDDVAYIGGDNITSGSGNITVSGGAQVNSSLTVIAGLAGSTASVTLSGANTTWAIGPTFNNALFIGSPGAQGAGGGGNGSLAILAGAHLTQDPSGGEPTISVSGNAAHPGVITVNGTGSLLQAGSTLNVGWTGPGHIDLSVGGEAVVGNPTPVPNTLVVDNSANLQGAGTVNGNVINNGFLTPESWALSGATPVPGEFSSRTFTINGNFTQSSAGDLTATIDGPSASTNTHLIVSGSATLAGTFFVIFNGSAAGNTTYSVITAASLSGTFDQTFSFGLDSPFYTDFSNLSVNGTVKVVDPSIFWTNAGGGSWQTGGNWSTTAAPTPLQAAAFNLPGASVPVTLAGDSTVFSTIFRNGNITLDLGGHSLIANVPAPLNNQTTAVVAVSDFAGSSANVTLSNGTVNVSTGNLSIGGLGNGSLSLGAGVTFTAGNIVLGAHAGGFGQLSVLANATLTAQQDMFVGNDGNGTVTQSGGSISTLDVFLAYDPSSNGNYTMTGGSLTTSFEILADDNGSVAVFNQSGGTHTINGELQLAGFDANSHATYNLSGTGLLSVTSNLTVGESGSASVVQTGGTAMVGQSVLLTPAPGETSLYTLQAGALSAASINAGAGGTFTQTGGTLSLSTGLVISGGNVSLAGSQTIYSFPALSITGGTLTLAGIRTVATSAYTLDGAPGAWNGLIDLGGGKLLVSDAITHATTLANLRDQVASARTNSNGITSSTLGAHMALAVLDNAVLLKTMFGGVAVDSSYVFVSPELLGDANADGRVDLTDLAAVLNNFGVATPAWTSGNFDGGPKIDVADLNDVLTNFGMTNPNAGGGALVATTESELPASVPEPATLAAIAPGAFALLKRRFRVAYRFRTATDIS